MAERLTPRTLDLEVLGSSLAHRVVSLDQELFSTLSLFIQVCQWVLVTYCWGVTLLWTSNPVQGGVAILLGLLHAMKTGTSTGRVGLWFMCALTLYPSQKFNKCPGRLISHHNLNRQNHAANGRGDCDVLGVT